MTSEELPGESYLTDNRSYLYEKYDIKPRYDDPDEEPDDATVGTRRYPPDWETRREAICNHYGWECGRCGRHVVKQDLETHVHHAKPLADGGTHELKNLILLCAPCHALLHPEADVGAFYNAPLFPARDADPRVAVEREPETTFEGYWYERQREPIPNAVPGYNEVSRSSKTTDVPAIVAVKKEKPTQEEYQAFQAGQDSPQNKPTTQSRAELTNSRARRENDDGEDEESHETYGRDQEPLSNTSQPQSTADRKQSGGKQRPHDQRKRAKEKLAEARSQRESDIASSSRSDWRRTQTMYSKPLEPGVPPPETVPDPEAADAAKERSQRKLERARRARARGEDLETAESPTPTPQPSGDADVPSDPEPRLDRESPDQGGDQTNDGAQSSASSDSSTSERLAVGLGWSVNRLVEGGLLALLTVPVLGVSIGMMRLLPSTAGTVLSMTIFGAGWLFLGLNAAKQKTPEVTPSTKHRTARFGFATGILSIGMIVAQLSDLKSSSALIAIIIAIQPLLKELRDHMGISEAIAGIIWSLVTAPAALGLVLSFSHPAPASGRSVVGTLLVDSSVGVLILLFIVALGGTLLSRTLFPR